MATISKQALRQAAEKAAPLSIECAFKESVLKKVQLTAIVGGITRKYENSVFDRKEVLVFALRN